MHASWLLANMTFFRRSVNCKAMQICRMKVLKIMYSVQNYSEGVYLGMNMNAVKVSSWQIKHFFDKQQSSTFFRQIIHLSELQEFTGATESFHFGWILCIVVCFTF